MVIWDKDDSKNPWSDINLLTGRYLLTFNVPINKTVPSWVEQSITVAGKTFTINKAYSQNNQFFIDISIDENPFPIALILATLLAAFSYLALVRVEKITDGFFPVMFFVGAALVYYIFIGRGKWDFT